MQQSIKARTDFDLKTALWDNCRIYARPRLDSLATRIETKMTWDDLILTTEKKQALQEIVWHVKQKYTVYGSWGFGRKKEDWELMRYFPALAVREKLRLPKLLPKNCVWIYIE
jgi:hypothetical protein